MYYSSTEEIQRWAGAPHLHVHTSLPSSLPPEGSGLSALQPAPALLGNELQCALGTCIKVNEGQVLSNCFPNLQPITLVHYGDLTQLHLSACFFPCPSPHPFCPWVLSPNSRDPAKPMSSGGSSALLSLSLLCSRPVRFRALEWAPSQACIVDDGHCSWLTSCPSLPETERVPEMWA